MSRQVCGGKKWVEKGETTCFFLFSLLRENLTKVLNLCKINYSFILVFIIYLYLFLDFLELILYQFIVIKLYVIKIKYTFFARYFCMQTRSDVSLILGHPVYVTSTFVGLPAAAATFFLLLPGLEFRAFKLVHDILERISRPIFNIRIFFFFFLR